MINGSYTFYIGLAYIYLFDTGTHYTRLIRLHNQPSYHIDESSKNNNNLFLSHIYLAFNYGT